MTEICLTAVIVWFYVQCSVCGWWLYKTLVVIFSHFYVRSWKRQWIFSFKRHGISTLIKPNQILIYWTRGVLLTNEMWYVEGIKCNLRVQTFFAFILHCCEKVFHVQQQGFILQCKTLCDWILGLNTTPLPQRKIDI